MSKHNKDKRQEQARLRLRYQLEDKERALKMDVLEYLKDSSMHRERAVYMSARYLKKAYTESGYNDSEAEFMTRLVAMTEKYQHMTGMRQQITHTKSDETQHLASLSDSDRDKILRLIKSWISTYEAEISNS